MALLEKGVSVIIHKGWDWGTEVLLILYLSYIFLHLSYIHFIVILYLFGIFVYRREMLKLKKFQGFMSIFTKAAASILVLMLFVTGGIYGVSAMTSGAGSNNQKTTYSKQTANNQLVSTKTSVNDGAEGFRLPAAGESEASLEAFTSEAKTLAAPSQLKYNALSDTKVKLTWSKVDHATVYFIYRKPLEGSYELIKKVHNTYWTDTVSSGQVYMYKVKAVEEPTVEELLPEGTIAITARHRAPIRVILESIFAI